MNLVQSIGFQKSIKQVIIFKMKKNISDKTLNSRTIEIARNYFHSQSELNAKLEFINGERIPVYSSIICMRHYSRESVGINIDQFIDYYELCTTRFHEKIEPLDHALLIKTSSIPIPYAIGHGLTIMILPKNKAAYVELVFKDGSRRKISGKGRYYIAFAIFDEIAFQNFLLLSRKLSMQ